MTTNQKIGWTIAILVIIAIIVFRKQIGSAFGFNSRTINDTIVDQPTTEIQQVIVPIVPTPKPHQNCMELKNRIDSVKASLIQHPKDSTLIFYLDQLQKQYSKMNCMAPPPHPVDSNQTV